MLPGRAVNSRRASGSAVPVKEPSVTTARREAGRPGDPAAAIAQGTPWRSD